MPNFDPAELTISEVAVRTGIPASTLRMWEARYGFPEPRRPGGTHRRYSDEDCRALLEVKGARARGLSMANAIAAGVETVRAAQNSVFNGLRLRHPEQPVLAMPEPFMQAISRALEDTVREHPDGLLVATFQRLPARRIAESRWEALARTARAVVLFADYPNCERDGALWRVPVREGTALAEEWAVVCDTPRWWGCLVGRERAGRQRQPGNRLFDAMWSLEPEVVRDGARIAAALASAAAPDLGDVVSPRLQHQPIARPSTLREASHVTNRVLDRLLDAARSAAVRAG
jgi:MerR family transcriptional regulator, light-induced transcriptional regulator